jgi:hypothetical protein
MRQRLRPWCCSFVGGAAAARRPHSSASLVFLLRRGTVVAVRVMKKGELARHCSAQVCAMPGKEPPPLGQGRSRRAACLDPRVGVPIHGRIETYFYLFPV